MDNILNHKQNLYYKNQFHSNKKDEHILKNFIKKKKCSSNRSYQKSMTYHLLQQI